jgi:hypothetical protein
LSVSERNGVQPVVVFERDLTQRKARGMPHNARLVPGNKKD